MGGRGPLWPVLLFALVAACGVHGGNVREGEEEDDGGGGGDDPSVVSYSADIAPIFAVNCFGCHPPLSNFDALTLDGLLAGGDSGPAVIPGDPNGSLILKRLRGEIAPQMPLGFQLDPGDIALIETWIADGAPNN